MAISVVIPAFNAGRFIRRTIDSVLAQTYSDYEIIVVDDGSTDNTGEVVKSYGSKVRYIYQENAGDGPARNTGIAAANGEWIAFLDHDDEWLAQRLEKQIELLKRNHELRWCGANFYKRSGNLKRLANNRRLMEKALEGQNYFPDFFEAVYKYGTDFKTSTMILHREIFERSGMFEAGWLRSADLDMWLRVAYHEPQIGYIPDPLAILHIEIQDVISTKLRLQAKRGEDDRRMMAKHLRLAEQFGCLERFKPLAASILRKRLITMIYHGFREDARKTTKQFYELLGWRWFCLTHLLTIFPKMTSLVAKSVAYFGRLFRLEREISRRWINLEKTEKRVSKENELPG